MSADTRPNIRSEFPLDSLPTDLRARFVAASEAAKGTAIGVSIKPYKWAGSEWSIHFQNATDVLTLVGGSVTGIFHRPSGSTDIFQTQLRLNGDPAANRAVLAAFGFAPEDRAVPARPDDELVAYVMKQIETPGARRTVVNSKPL